MGRVRVPPVRVPLAALGAMTVALVWSCEDDGSPADPAGETGGSSSGHAGSGTTKPRGGSGGQGRGGAGTGGSTAGTESMGGEAGAGGAPGGAGQGGTPSGGTGARPVPGRCENPSVWSSNLERCNGDFVHRPAASACSVPVRDTEIEGLAGNAGTEDLVACELYQGDECILERNECTRDDDCGVGSFCVRDTYDNYDFSHRIIHRCAAPCQTDANCAENELCACDTVQQNATRELIAFGVCIPAACRVDADCGDDSFCIAPLNRLTTWHVGSSLSRFECQTAGDECHGPETCPYVDPNSGSGCCLAAFCRYEEERYACSADDTCDPC